MVWSGELSCLVTEGLVEQMAQLIEPYAASDDSTEMQSLSSSVPADPKLRRKNSKSLSLSINPVRRVVLYQQKDDVCWLVGILDFICS